MGAVRRLGRAIDKAIIQPVIKTVEAVVSDPRKLAGVAISVAFPGAGAAIGSALGLGTTAAAQVVGQALLNTALNGGDVKAAVISAALPVVGKAGTDALTKTLAESNITGAVNQVITRAVTQGTTAAILGKDPLSAALLGGVTAGVNAIVPNIPGYTDLPAAARNAINSAIATKLTGGDVGGAVSQSLVNDAIEWAKSEVNKTPNAIKAAKATYKFDTGRDLSDEQAAELLGVYGADGLAAAADRLYTSDAEARDIWRQTVGTEPTEFDLMEIIGLDETQAGNIAYNKADTTIEEAQEFLRDLYGGDIKKITNQQIMDLIGQPESVAKAKANDFYTEDENTVSPNEAVILWKKAGFGDFPNESQMKALQSVSEAEAESLALRMKDIEQTTFDGTGYGSLSNAKRAAIAAGYNTFTWDGKSYTGTTTPETKKVEDKRYLLTEGVLQSQGTSIAKATDEQLRDAMAKVDAIPTGMLGNASLQDVLKGTYSTVNSDGTLRLEISGAAAVVGSPNWRKATDQLPAGMVLANESEVWGANGARNPKVEYAVLPDGTTAFVKRADGNLPSDFSLRAFDIHGSLDDLAANDPEAWLHMASQFDKNANGNVGDYLTKTANSLMLGAYATGNNAFGDSVKQTLSIGTQGVGEQITNMATFFTDRLGMDHNSAMAAAGKALQEWGANNQSKSTKDQEASIISAVSNAKTVGEKIGAFVTAAKDNPGGLMTMIAKEGIQEILPLWAAKAAYRFGTLAAVSANTAIEAIESWGAGTKETYDQAKKMGFSDSDARIMASKVGLQSAVITAVTNGFGDTPLVRNIIGDAITDSALGITKAAGREAFTEYFDGLASNAVQQYQLTGTVNWDQATTAATIGAGIGAGTSSGIMLGAAINNGAVIGKGVDGSDVTYEDFLSGAKQVDMKTVSLNTQVGTDSDGDAITLGNIVAMPVAAGLPYEAVKSGLPEELTSTDVVLGTDELGNTVTLSSLMEGVTDSQSFDDIYKDLLDITPEQRTEAKLAQQNVATKKDIQDAIAGIQIPTGLTQADVSSAISEYMKVNPNVTAADVAGAISEYMTANPGLTKTDLDNAVTAATKDFATTQDIESAIAGIQFPDGLSKEDVKFAISDYMAANPGLSLSDVASKITEATSGLATSEGVATAIGDALKGYATTQDIKNAIADIKFPAGLTEADVTSAIKTYMTANPGLSLADVASKIGEATKGLATSEGVKSDIAAAVKGFATGKDIETAIANIKFPAGITKADVAAEIKAAMEANPGLSAADVTKSITDYMTANPGLTATDLNAAISEATKDLATTAQLTNLQNSLADEIQAAKDIGLEGDAAIQAGLDSLAEKVGTNQADLLTQLGTTAAELKTQFATDIAASQAATAQEIANTKTALETAIADAKAAGLEGDAALQAAIEAVAADQQTSAADLLSKLGTTEANLKTEFETGLAGVTSDIEATRTALQEAIQAAKDIGLEGDAALKAAIDSVAATQQTSAADLLSKLGTTEATLRSDMEAGLAGVTTSIADTKTALEAAIADAKAAGLEGDAALKAAIDAVAADQQTSAADLLTKLGTTEANLKTEFEAGLAGVTSDIEATRTALQDAIKAAQDIGLEGDAALQAAIESVAADQKTSAADLLTKLGTTEEALRSDMETGFAGVAASIADTKTALEAAIADAKASGLEGDAALKAAIESVAATQKTSATDLLTKLGTTEAGLKSEFAAGLAGVSAEVADTRKALEDAIQAAKDIGLEGDAALQAGIESVAAELGTTKEALLGQLGTTEATLRSEMEAGLSGVAASIADTKTALEAAIADAKASGLEGDAALKAAIDSVAADQKTNAADLLTKLGTTEAGLKTEFAAGLAGVSAEVADTRKALEDAIQAAKDIGLQGDAALQAGIDSVAANLGTTKEALLTQLGTTEETLRADMEAGLAGVTTSIADTKKALETAIADAKASGLEGDAALKAAIDSVAADQQTNAADLLTKLGTTEAGLKTEFEAGLAGVSTEIANAKKALEDAIQAAKDIGLEGDVALQAGIDSVASELGITKEALLTQLGTTEQALRTEFATGITSLETQMKAQYDALTAAQKAEADARLAQGQTLEQAIAAAKGETAGQISELEAATKAQYETLTAAQKAAADALVAQGQTLQDAITAAKTETAGQIADVETRLTDAIAAAEAMGLSRDQAITAAVDSVAADLGTTRADLLTQLGTTEETLRTEFATGISGLEAQTKAQYDSLSAAQKATADALVAQGTTLADAIASAQQQTAGQIADVETRLTDAIAAAEAMGLSRDQAITAAVESVAADLGTTKTDLLTQLGTTEQALRTEFTTGLAGVSAEVKAAYDSLTADQKALADQLAQQGVDLTTAIQTAQAQTAGQIGELTADVQAKYDALTAEQKALANQLTQQGVDLNTAIATAQQQTQQQITNLGVEVDARINELMQQGQTYQQATQQAFAEVNAKNQEMAGLIGTQGRAASQQDIDALNQMLGGQRSMDLAYDVTGDKQITQADIDFLTQVVGGVKTDWTAPQESPWAATGLYGQIQANELRRQQDLAAAEAQRQAEQQAAAERARQESVRGGLRTTALQGQQQLQALQQQLPQAMQMAQTTTTPIYGEMGPYLDLGSPLDFDFFKPSPEKQAATKQAQPTKIAAGGYIDDLLAGDMTADDLLNLLR